MSASPSQVSSPQSKQDRDRTRAGSQAKPPAMKGPRSAAPRRPFRPYRRAIWIGAAVAIVGVVLIAGILGGVLRIPGVSNNPSSGGPPGTGGNSGSLTVDGAFFYQPQGTNYTSTARAAVVQGLASGLIQAKNGSVFRVSLPPGLANGFGLAFAGTFKLSPDPNTSGLYAIRSLTPAVPGQLPTAGAEVNITLDSIAVPISGVTVGFGVGSSTAYVAFGSYPAFFSNVTLQGVALNLSAFNTLFNVNLPWYQGIARAFGLANQFTLDSVVLVNGSISLPSSTQIHGQAQLVVTPSNVSAFVSSLDSGLTSLPSSTVSQYLGDLSENLVVVAAESPAVFHYFLVLGPSTLDRAALSGMVTLDYEPSNLGLALNSGTNSALVGNPAHFSASVGVTWDHSPVAATGYQTTEVKGLWTVPTYAPVQVRAPAIGGSLTSLAHSLAGMGYDLTQYSTAIASIANPAIFVIIDPSIIGNLNATLSYQSYALAIVPSDILNPSQNSATLYLQLQGVVYNASYYGLPCAGGILRGCPVLVVDTLSFGQPTKYLPTRLQGLTSPSFIRTTGFLTGTTAKTIANFAGIGGLSELARLSPFDVGFYDTGYSDGTTGYNLPTLYFTWGTGPTLRLANNDSVGLFVPASSIASATDLMSVYDQVSTRPWDSTSLSLFKSDIKSAYDYALGSGVFNGSTVVPGVYLMLESWSNASQGFVLAGLSGAGVVGCGVQTCYASNVTLSANSGSYFFPPEIIGVSTNLTDSTNSYTNLLTSSTLWWGSIPTSYGLGVIACNFLDLCGVNPFHVLKIELQTCLSFSCLVADGYLSGLAVGMYTVTYPLTWNGVPWFTLGTLYLNVT